MKILIVEDDEGNRNLLIKQLRAYSHEVTAATNGAEALEQALAQPPDMIVSDILMPKMDGYQLCHECKQNEQLKNIPFVFYTATCTLDEDKKFALSLGVDAFILKPSEPDVFVQTLNEIFEKSKSGALAQPEVAPLEPSLFLAEHNKRIVAKLEKKVTQLEVEITERKQAEEELKKSESALAEAQHLAHIGSWELDLVTNTLTWSDEVYRMFGLEPQQFEATYEAFLDNIHPDDREMVNKAYTESVRTKTPYNIVHRLLLKDGTVKYVNERCETFYDDGKGMGVFQGYDSNLADMRGAL